MKRRFAFIVSIVMLVFTACGVDYKPTKTGVFVKADQSLEGAYVESFDKETYRLEDLQAMGQQEVQAYNKAHANLDFYCSNQTEEKLPISLDRIEQQDSNVIVQMSYATAEDYMAFNADEIALAGGSQIYTEQLSATAVALEGEFVTVKGEQTTIDEIMKHGEYQLVYVNYATDITVEGKIAYVSTNVNCNSINSANTPAGQNAYIIFKK